jgi:ADP-ribose pyrophosphatase YjhB (NUDIX family)
VGRVEHLHVARAAGAPMEARARVDVAAGVGVRGDRYSRGAGFWRDDRVSRDLTLVEAEVVEELGLRAGETRRNVTTRGIELNGLVGRTFWIGDVLARGTSLCNPCRHLEEVTGRRLLRALVHHGGLRADALTSGRIAVGDSVVAVEEQSGVGAVVVRGGRVLLGRRLSAHGRGTWSFPGGRPEAGETPVATAIRELREETGLVARGGHVVAETLDGFPGSRLLFRTRVVVLDDVRGEPRPREPDTTAAWRWCDWRRLPQPLFRPVASFVAAWPRPFSSVRPPVALPFDVVTPTRAEAGCSEHEQLEAVGAGFVASPRAGWNAHRVPEPDLDDLVVELHPPAPAHDDVDLLLLPVRVPVREAVPGRDALVAEAGPLERERVGGQAELQLRRTVEVGPDVLQVAPEVSVRERHARDPIAGLCRPAPDLRAVPASGGGGNRTPIASSADGVTVSRRRSCAR